MMGGSLLSVSSAALTPWEHWWLGYARRLLADEGHRTACAGIGGSRPSDVPAIDDPDLRWPGYLGRAYRPGGVLCVGKVHRNFRSGSLPADLGGSLVDATREFSAGTLSDAGYLAAVRAAYAVGLAGAWRVGETFSHALGPLGVDVDEIVYVNAARCQFPQPAPSDLSKRRQDDLVRLCLRATEYPITELVAALRPSLVLIMPVVAYELTSDLVDTTRTLVVAVNQYLNDARLQRPLNFEDL